MKASTQYDDLLGTAAAELSSKGAADKFEFIADSIGLNKQRFTIVGIKLTGLPETSVTLICLDKELSTDENDYMVDMYLEEEGVLIESIVERFSVVLYDRFDQRYSKIDEIHEVNFSDFHEEGDDQ